MTSPPTNLLHELGPRTLSHTRFFGAFLATHAVEDAICFLHSGEGCKTKTQHHLVFHDWFRESHDRRIWTDITDVHLVKGSSGKLESMVRDWSARHSPGIILVLTPAFMEATGEDFPESVRRLEAELGLPVRLVSAAGYEGDLFDGYLDAQMRMLECVDWGRKPTGGINIIGHFFDRYEADRVADVGAITQLAGALGAPVRSIFLSGGRFESLLGAWQATVNVVMPYAAANADAIARLTGRPSVVVDLPIGLIGTQAWLRKVGAALGVSDSGVQAHIDCELGPVVPVLDKLVSRLGEADAGRSCAIFADTPLAAALSGFLSDLQLPPGVVGLLDRSLGGESSFLAALDRLGPRGTEVGAANEGRSSDVCPERSRRDFRGQSMRQKSSDPVERLLVAPTRAEVVEAMSSLDRAPDILFGSSVELNDLRSLGRPGIEVGFPSFFRHGLAPLPMFGFNGALHLAQRILQALSAVY